MRGTNIGGRSVITPKITATMERTIKVHRGAPSIKLITIHLRDTSAVSNMNVWIVALYERDELK